MQPARPNPEDTIPLRLAEEDRGLILREARLSDGLEARLKFAMVEKDAVVVRLTLDDFDELLDSIGYEVRFSKPKRMRKVWERLYDDIDEALEEATASADFDDDEIDTDDIVASLQGFVNEFLTTPHPQLSNLTPLQVTQLAYSDWKGKDSAIHLNQDLPLADLEAVPLFVNARRFMNVMQVAGGVKATVAGNLNRKFVARMLDTLSIGKEELEEIRRYNKVINETDAWVVHIVRVLLDLGRLIRRTKGTFSITKRGRSLLADSRAGALYALLFRTQFQVFNLDYFGGWENPAIQETVGYSLYRIRELADDWIPPNELAPNVLSPLAEEFIPATTVYDALTSQVCSRILDPLESFGLLERRELPSDDRYLKPYEIRKTALFDRLLRFQFPDDQS